MAKNRAMLQHSSAHRPVVLLVVVVLLLLLLVAFISGGGGGGDCDGSVEGDDGDDHSVSLVVSVVNLV